MHTFLISIQFCNIFAFFFFAIGITVLSSVFCCSAYAFRSLVTHCCRLLAYSAVLVQEPSASVFVVQITIMGCNIYLHAIVKYSVITLLILMFHVTMYL